MSYVDTLEVQADTTVEAAVQALTFVRAVSQMAGPAACFAYNGVRDCPRISDHQAVAAGALDGGEGSRERSH